MRFMKQLPDSRWHNITNYKQIQGTTLALDVKKKIEMCIFFIFIFYELNLNAG